MTSAKYPTRFVVKCTKELKGAYLGLCRAKGVSASDEIRAFVVRELQEAMKYSYTGLTKGGSWPAENDDTENKKPSEPVQKCENTLDMFPSDS